MTSNARSLHKTQVSVTLPRARSKQLVFGDQLRRAIETCGLSRYAIWKATGIDQPTLSRFMRGKSGLTIESIDKICQLISARLIVPRKTKRKTKDTRGR
jgi:transcriptional regulator with XRE-family HTH domain